MHQGCVEEGIAVPEEGLAAWEATGTQLALPYFRARLAEAFLIAGDREKGFRALEESFLHKEEVWWLAEQNRLRAELLLCEPSTVAEAEAVLRAAQETARSQNSKSLKLRVTVSLARVLRQSERAAEGRDMLAKCYSWFAEGLDPLNVREARELLALLV